MKRKQPTVKAESMAKLLTGVRIDPKKITLARGHQITVACYENGDILVTLGPILPPSEVSK